MDAFDPWLHLDELEAPLSWETVFGRTAPVEIEVGIGKGTLLRRLAAASPDRDFVGIERALKYLRIAAQRVARDRQTNIRLVRAEAISFLETFVPDASVAVFHIYFIDPWPKRRHGKRRFFQPETVRLLERKTAPGGCIRVRTDVDWYFDAIVGLFRQASPLEILEQGRSIADATPAALQTNYEVKYRAVGKPIYAATMRRPPGAPDSLPE